MENVSTECQLSGTKTINPDKSVEERIESEEEYSEYSSDELNWLFDRQRDSNISVNEETVTVLNFPKNIEIPPCPDNENPTEWLKAFQGATVYLVGTAHFSEDSQKDVENTIQLAQPDLVMVELCSSRTSTLYLDENSFVRNSEMNFPKFIKNIREKGVGRGVLYSLLSSLSGKITREMNMAPGGEFRAAFDAASKISMCRVALGDRPIEITLGKALNSLTYFQRAKLIWNITMSTDTIKKEEIESCKKQDFIQSFLTDTSEKHPEFAQAIIHERDDYMRYTLQSLLVNHTVDKRLAYTVESASEWQPLIIVAVIGIAHTPGIIEKWNDPVDITTLNEFPSILV